MRHQFTVQSNHNMNNSVERRRNIVIEQGGITVTGIPAFEDNVIWLIHAGHTQDQGSQPVCIVDPGDAEPVIDYCRRHQFIPVSVLLTHHHADHTGGVAEIWRWVQAHHPESRLPVYGPAAEGIPDVNVPLVGGEDIVLFGDVNARVLAVAGHTRGHLAYLLSAEADCRPPALFSGDLLFGLGCGRLFEGTAEQMYEALMTVARLDAETRIYCAHEYTALNLPFALKVDPANAALLKRAVHIRTLRQQGESTLPLLLCAEKETNPFLRINQPALVAATCLEGQAEPVEIFATLRKMRDIFKSA